MEEYVKQDPEFNQIIDDTTISEYGGENICLDWVKLERKKRKKEKEQVTCSSSPFKSEAIKIMLRYQSIIARCLSPNSLHAIH